MTTTGALISAMGGVITLIVGTVLAYFIKRTSTASKMNQDNIRDQQWVMRLVSIMRDDYWALSSFAYTQRAKLNVALLRLVELGDPPQPEPAKVPAPQHQVLEAAHAEDLSDADEK